jgi:hypothetical protein
MEEVTCRTCGFLTAATTVGGSDFVEVEPAYRRSGCPQRGTKHTRQPVCFRGVEIAAEYKTADGQEPTTTDDRATIYLTVISRPRACHLYTEYEPGLDPQEHQDVVDAQKTELAKMKWDAAELRRKIAADAAEGEKRRADDWAKHREEMKEKYRYRWTNALTTIIVAIISAVAAYYAALAK